ncbi:MULTISPECIES: caspase family protein [Streptomyces]|uniref:Caspase family protein n=1 Tax=Streptomyces virginiae TaxID=1961 RepID=A0ABZ1T404_STRVG|nr:caspase family protein [Streptomyces virginiae]WTB20199.1 caspase family protein [Streptomyces virginiae]
MTKRALLVGIDLYPDPRNNLNSCVADTLAIRNMLEGLYDFDPTDIQLVHNQNATLTNVLDQRLFTGVTSGDQIVFFQSSHGYSYPEGSTMVEVLCLYDGFLKDTDLVGRTLALPPNVLTVILDSCHSGGMSKRFVTTQKNGSTQCHVAKGKFWTPDPERADRDAQLLAQVTQFKFFGRSATADAGAIAKNLMINPVGVPAAKSVKEAAAELNGVLFSACLANETAAAGSPPTDQLSAFTYALINDIRPDLPVAELNRLVSQRLDRLNMTQHPIAMAPFAQPHLLTQTLFSTGGGTKSFKPDEQISNIGDSVEAWLYENLSDR